MCYRFPFVHYCRCCVRACLFDEKHEQDVWNPTREKAARHQLDLCTKKKKKNLIIPISIRLWWCALPFLEKLCPRNSVDYVKICIILLYYRVPNTGIVSAITGEPDGHVSSYYFHGFERKNIGGQYYILRARAIILFHYCVRYLCFLFQAIIY